MKRAIKLLNFITILCLTMVMFFAFSSSVMAKNDIFEVKVESGFDQEVCYSYYFPVSFNFTNVTSNFEGTINVYANGSSVIRYDKDFTISKGEEKKIPVYIECSKSIMKIYYDIVDKNGKVVESRKVDISADERINNAYIGVISDDAKSLGYFSSFSLSNGCYNNSVCNLSPSNIGSYYQEIDMFDIIVINGYNSEQLSSEQINTIVKWVDNGGILVFGTGENGKKSFSSFKEFSDKISLGKMSKRTISNTLGDKLEINSYNIDAPKEAAMRDNDNEILSSYFKYGDGTVTVFGYDLGQTDTGKFLSDSKNSSSSMSTIMENIFSEDRENRICCDDDSYDYYDRDNISTYLRNSVDGLINGDFPNIPIYIVIIVLYLIVSIPAIFIILKKKDKAKYSYLFFISSAVIFTIIIYLCGIPTRITEPYINYVSIIEDDGESTEEKTYVGLQSPNNDNYSVTLLGDNYIIPEQVDDFYYDDETIPDIDVRDKYSLSIKNTTKGTTIGVNNNSMFTVNTLQIASKNKEASVDVEVNLSSALGKIEGTIKNNGDYVIEDAFLYQEGKIIPIGDIEANELIKVNEEEDGSNTISCDYYDYSQLSNLLSMIIKSDDYVANNRKNIVSNIIQFGSNDYYNSMYNGYKTQDAKLIYFTSNEDMTVESEEDYKVNGVTVYIKDFQYSSVINGISYKENLPEYDKIRDEDTYSNEYVYDSQSHYINQVLTIHKIENYIVNYNVTDMESIYFEENYQTYDENVFRGEIYLYNDKTKNYVELNIKSEKDPVKLNDTYKDCVMTDVDGTEYIKVKYAPNQDTINNISIYGCMIMPIINGEGSAK